MLSYVHAPIHFMSVINLFWDSIHLPPQFAEVRISSLSMNVSLSHGRLLLLFLFLCRSEMRRINSTRRFCWLPFATKE